ncbi:GNAT family acetyltransferase [Burkholderia stagnalis]|uniref:GNAT family acetyltransferase n=1 Tax=Burkholderia stagnalis TaxID=1503054 RepID=UPI002AB37FBC|nr:GNAT family acetyltransferase [Burkholderia stagnalis]MDY7802818.1 GNAT family acetyltransferase [Burkholderia stagnalis]
MIAERLRPDHVLSVELQPAQMTSAGLITSGYADLLCKSTQVGWALIEDGNVLGCGGLVECWENRAQAWTLISAALLPRFRPAHRMVKSILADAPWRRIEMDVDIEHRAGIAWAHHLGFVQEGVRRKYTVDGRDVILFARVK